METQKILEAYLEAWKNKDYEKMFELCQLTWKEGKKEVGLKNFLGINYLADYKIISSTIQNSVKRLFAVELYFTSGYALSSVVNVICEAAPYKPATYGTWGVNPVSALKPVVIINKGKVPQKKPASKKK